MLFLRQCSIIAETYYMRKFDSHQNLSCYQIHSNVGKLPVCLRNLEIKIYRNIHIHVYRNAFIARQLPIIPSFLVGKTK